MLALIKQARHLHPLSRPQAPLLHSFPTHGLPICNQLSGKTAASRRAHTSAQSTKTRKLLRRQVIEHPANTKLCISASKCERYDLAKVMVELQAQGLGFTASLDAVHTRINDADVFILENGTAVAWNMSENDVVNRLLKVIARGEINPFNDTETEDMDYTEETTTDPNVRSGMIGDCIYINGPTETNRCRDKLAFSSGLARHTKLSAIEMRVETLIDQVRNISNRLAAGKKVDLGHHKIMKLTGRLLQVRGALNLYSGITETPDVYWTEPELERLYDLISHKLDVKPRIEILNKKLDYLADTVSIVKSNISEKISLRLEWMIIALITIEVIFELRHFINWSETEVSECVSE